MFSVKLWRDLEIWVRGHPWPLKMAPFDNNMGGSRSNLPFFTGVTSDSCIWSGVVISPTGRLPMHGRFAPFVNALYVGHRLLDRFERSKLIDWIWCCVCVCTVSLLHHSITIKTNTVVGLCIIRICRIYCTSLRTLWLHAVTYAYDARLRRVFYFFSTRFS